jgi:hypothetical protein
MIARSASDSEPLGFLKLNDEFIVNFSLSKNWVRSQIVIPSSALRKGVNRISLRWPELCVNEENAIELATRRFRMGVDADLFAVFGEIYSMKLTTEQS